MWGIGKHFSLFSYMLGAKSVLVYNSVQGVLSHPLKKYSEPNKGLTHIKQIRCIYFVNHNNVQGQIYQLLMKTS